MPTNYVEKRRSKTLKVFFDCRMLFMSGIGRYIENVLARLPKLIGDSHLVLAGDAKQICGFLDKQPGLRDIVTEVTNFRASIYSISEHVYGSLLLHTYGEKTDLVHFPHYSVPWMLPGNSVVTVHDLIHFRFPEYYSTAKLRLAKSVLRNAVKKAGRVIADSQATASDLVQMFPELTEKVRVVHLGVSGVFCPKPAAVVDEFKRKYGLGRYLLYVGNRKPHKNLGRLLKAYARLKREIPSLQLVIVGKRFSDQDEVTNLIAELKLSNVIELEQTTDDELLHLYCGAEALVLPSLYEGFGLPALEAMACGVPVVVSNTSSLPEVVGEAGVYIDPYEVEDIASGIYRVLTDDDLHRHLREKGLAHARVFTWEKLAQQTLEVYHEVLMEKRR